MIILRYILLIGFSLIILGCFSPRENNKSNEILILDYEDFGPPVIAENLLDSPWYQWESHGDSDPQKKDNIKIVVYNNIRLDAVKNLYPVNKNKLQDFRYVKLEDALLYLRRTKQQFPNDEILSRTFDKIQEFRNVIDPSVV